MMYLTQYLVAASMLFAWAPITIAQQRDGGIQRVNQKNILVFSKTAGFRHDSIEDGVQAIHDLGEENGFGVTHSEDATSFDDESLSHFDAVVFLSTTGDVLNDLQQQAFERFIQSGGGYVGVHSAADTEYDWKWYGDLMGAYFSGHPRIQDADIILLGESHSSTSHLPSPWQRRDEWYNYKSAPVEGMTILLSLDEASYEGGTMGTLHPIAWCHEFDGGRAWYTGGGHTKASFREKAFLEHLAGGILWAAGSSEVDE